MNSTHVFQTKVYFYQTIEPCVLFKDCGHVPDRTPLRIRVFVDGSAVLAAGGKDGRPAPRRRESTPCRVASRRGPIPSYGRSSLSLGGLLIVWDCRENGIFLLCCRTECDRGGGSPRLKKRDPQAQ